MLTFEMSYAIRRLFCLAYRYDFPLIHESLKVKREKLTHLNKRKKLNLTNERGARKSGKLAKISRPCL